MTGALGPGALGPGGLCFACVGLPWGSQTVIHWMPAIAAHSTIRATSGVWTSASRMAMQMWFGSCSTVPVCAQCHVDVGGGWL